LGFSDLTEGAKSGTQQHQDDGSEKVRHKFLLLLMFTMCSELLQAIGNNDYKISVLPAHQWYCLQ